MSRYILEPRMSERSFARYAVVDSKYRRPEDRVLCVVKFSYAKRITASLNFEEEGIERTKTALLIQGEPK